MKAGTEFLIAELKDLIRRDPPYSEKFVQRVFMALRQALAVIETNETKVDNLAAEISRLERSQRAGWKPQTDRNNIIVREFKLGATTGELSRKYSLSRQRIHNIVTRAKERGLY